MTVDVPIPDFELPPAVDADPQPPRSWFYAQLNGEGYCTSVQETAGEIVSATMVEIDSLDAALVGQRRVNGAWQPALPPSPTKPYIDAVDAHLDAGARAHGYDGIVSACSYAAAPNAFQGEGIAYLQWRGACWEHCHGVLAAVTSNQRPVPTPAELVAELPALVLPT